MQLALVRWRLARTLRSYQLFKHIEIFDPIVSDGFDPQRHLAREMKTRCVAMGETFERHITLWSASKIEGTSSSYERETGGILQAIRNHLLRERVDLDRLLTGIEDIRHLRTPRPAPLQEGRL